MKKLLLTAALALGVSAFTFAQTIYSENFETSMTSMPAGWSVGSASHHPGNPGWVFSNAWVGSLWNSYVPTHTYCAYVNDIDNNSGVVDDYDTLYTSSFNCSAYSHLFLSFDLNFNNYTGGEVGTVIISTNGGATWTRVATLPVLSGDVSWYNGQVFNLTSYAAGQSNVMLGFTWNNVGAVAQGYAGWGMAIDNISVYVPQNYDLGVTAQNLSSLMQVGTAYTFTGVVSNFGGDSIVSMHLNYSVNGGPAQTDNITGLSGFNGLMNYGFSHTIPFTPSAPGSYTVKFWADNLNGANVDQNHSNDTLVAIFTAYDTLAIKYPLFEEFNQASCDPCAVATPNLDSVLWNNRNYSNAVRYHVSWPGQDFMNQVTDAPFVSSRVSYYGVSGVPDAKLDGSMDEYPGTISSTDIQNEAAIGSPFRITIKTCTYNPMTNMYNFSADIKSFGNFSGLVARVALTIDTLNYANNQSTESIPQYNFPQVAEDMMPNANGTTLSTFTPNSVQTVTTSWTKNHPWGASPKTWKYDSTTLNHITIWIQDNGTKYIYQSATAVATIVTGIKEVRSGVYMNVYPNPANGNAYVAYNLEQGQNVKVEVSNVLGEKVYSENEGKVDAGNHIITINTSNLQNGVYFVRFSTDNGTTTKRLVIQR